MTLASRRAKILTGSMAVAVITGSLYGAGLKSRSEQKQIAREELIAKRDKLDRQIQEVKTRQAKRRAEQRE
ncbi:hypothetical protein KEM54_006876 [Ascosphaera aggregata]|nr:hypothetical protein KEM54_006876 [Ascosphaera aggregata]